MKQQKTTQHQELLELLQELKSKSISLEYSRGRIKYRGPEDVITEDIIAKLRKHKSALIRHLWPFKGNLMPINPGGSGIPLIFVHGDEGNYLLSHHLSEDQPLFGYMHVGAEGEHIHLHSVKEYAAHYLNQLRNAIPDGPYYLAGHSFGGLIAWEMAATLEAENIEVAGLILLDSGNPELYPTIRKDPLIKQIFRKDLLPSLMRFGKRKIHKARIRLSLALNMNIPRSVRNTYIVNQYGIMARAYIPPELNTRVLLFRATDNVLNDRHMGWRKKVKNIRVVNLLGNHNTLLRHQVSIDLFIRELTGFMGQNKQQYLAS